VIRVSELDELLGIDLNDPTQKLACDLVESEHRFMADLVAARKHAGLSQTDVAERMGVPPRTVTALESSYSDPCLSTLRRYCLAIGVYVAHDVIRPA
jgi:DNA-binding XRE family transcriptional regulator